MGGRGFTAQREVEQSQFSRALGDPAMDGTTPSRAEPVVGKYGCTGKNRLGRPCNARVIRGRDVCVRHSMSDEEWHAQAKRGGRTRWDNERAGRRLEEIQHAQLKARFAEELVAALDAKIPGTAEPDHDRVQTALYVIAQNFRFTRADLEEWVSQHRPKLLEELRSYHLLDVEAARARLQAAYESGRFPRPRVYTRTFGRA
jgi:hypothetical protein